VTLRYKTLMCCLVLVRHWMIPSRCSVMLQWCIMSDKESVFAACLFFICHPQCSDRYVVQRRTVELVWLIPNCRQATTVDSRWNGTRLATADYENR
jgi:hypothetical protein